MAARGLQPAAPCVQPMQPCNHQSWALQPPEHGRTHNPTYTARMQNGPAARAAHNYRMGAAYSS